MRSGKHSDTIWLQLLYIYIYEKVADSSFIILFFKLNVTTNLHKDNYAECIKHKKNNLKQPQ